MRATSMREGGAVPWPVVRAAPGVDATPEALHDALLFCRSSVLHRHVFGASRSGCPGRFRAALPDEKSSYLIDVVDGVRGPGTPPRALLSTVRLYCVPAAVGYVFVRGVRATWLRSRSRRRRPTEGRFVR